MAAPLAPLRRVPLAARADVYRFALSVGLIAATAAALTDGVARVVLFAVGNLTAIFTAALAAANTPKESR